MLDTFCPLGNIADGTLCSAVLSFLSCRCSSNITMAFFSDQLANGGFATFYVPTTANFIDVRVSQSFLSVSDNVVVQLWRGSMVVHEEVCYQDINYINRLVGCGVMRQCLTRYLGPQNGSSFIDRLTVRTSPDNSAYGECWFTSSVTVAFQSRAVPDVTDTTDCLLRCPATGLCIPEAQVCDGIVQCPGGNEDEVLCSAYTLVEEDRGFHSSALMSEPTVISTRSQTVNDCKIRAIAGRYSAFSHNSTHCSLLSLNATVVLSPFGPNTTITAIGTSTFVRFGTFDSTALAQSLRSHGTSLYGGCSDAYSCSGRGTSTGTSRSNCVCVCEATYVGSQCTETRYDRTAQYFVFELSPVADSTASTTARRSLGSTSATSSGSSSAMIMPTALAVTLDQSLLNGLALDSATLSSIRRRGGLIRSSCIPGACRPPLAPYVLRAMSMRPRSKKPHQLPSQSSATMPRRLPSLCRPCWGQLEPYRDCKDSKCHQFLLFQSASRATSRRVTVNV